LVIFKNIVVETCYVYICSKIQPVIHIYSIGERNVVLAPKRFYRLPLFCGKLITWKLTEKRSGIKGYLIPVVIHIIEFTYQVCLVGFVGQVTEAIRLYVLLIS